MSDQPDWERRLRDIIRRDGPSGGWYGGVVGHADLAACLAALDAARALARELADRFSDYHETCLTWPPTMPEHRMAAPHCDTCQLLTRPDVRALREAR